ncbi:hypothetical protein BT93_A0045 [Corymbia citriodora subsp. variegata]|nr:hypothetical protein BT93_A0045 [Corymbia citriodora subsp. variegata]
MGDQGNKPPSQQKPPIDDKKLRQAVYVHQKALDDLVTVNSLFTVAVFVGLAFATGEHHNIAGKEECEAGVHVARKLVENEVISFAFYLFSSLVAKSLKTYLFTYIMDQPDIKRINNWSSKLLRGSLFFFSTSASVIGSVFLLCSMIDTLQIQLGRLSCKGTETLNSVGVLLGVSILALLIYIPYVLGAILKSTWIFDNLLPGNFCGTCYRPDPQQKKLREPPSWSPLSHVPSNPQ